MRFSDANFDFVKFGLATTGNARAEMRAQEADGTIEIDTRAMSPGTYQVTALAFDRAGNGPDQPVSTGLELVVDHQVSLPAGLHFVSVPSATGDAAPDAVLHGARWQLSRFDSAEQAFVRHEPATAGESLFAFRAGRGLWLWLDEPTVMRVPGEPPLPVGYTLALSKGWNSVGNPYERDLPWEPSAWEISLNGTVVGSLDDPAAQELVPPYVWTFDAKSRRHSLVTDVSEVGKSKVIPWMHGFWVYAARDGVSLSLTPPAHTSASRAVLPVSPRDWTLGLTAQADKEEAGLTVGVGSALRQALEVEDPPSPLPPSGLRLQVVSGTRRLSGDIRPAEGQSWTWDLAVSRAGAGPVTMSWPRLLRQVPRGLVVELADLATGRAMVLNTCSSYAFTAAAGEERRLRLTARLGHVERSEITGFTVTANRAGGSSVALTLSAPADVRVMVRGLGGSLVRELSRRAATAGTTSLVWDGLDSVGRRVPRGVYVLEAVAVAANGAATRATRTLLVR